MYFKSICFSLLSMFSFITTQAQTFELKGKITNAEKKKIYLIKSDGSPFYLENQPLNIIDSSVINNGVFIFKGKLKEPSNVSIKIKNGRQFTFILESGITNILTDANAMWNTRILNSKENTLYKNLWSTYHWAADSSNKFVDSYYINIKLKNAKRAIEDSLQYIYFNNLYDTLRKNKTEEFIINNPESFVSLSQLNLYFKDFGVDKSLYLLSLLQNRFAKHSLTKLVNAKIFQLKNTVNVGDNCPDFELIDTAGNKLKLISIKAKVIIIDFWASWCAPCRQENPMYRKLYAEFKNNGLEIMSIILPKIRTVS